MHPVARKVLLAATIFSAANCKTSGDHPAPDGAVPATVTDGETDVRQETPADQNELAKVPMSLWSPAQRRSTASYYYLVAEYVGMKERDAKKALSLFEAAY